MRAEGGFETESSGLNSAGDQGQPGRLAECQVGANLPDGLAAQVVSLQPFLRDSDPARVRLARPRKAACE